MGVQRNQSILLRVFLLLTIAHTSLCAPNAINGETIKDEVLADSIVIESPRITNWGTWGVTENCPEREFVYGMRLKVLAYAGIFGDDTSLNAIELLCISPVGRANNPTEAKAFSTITSKVGHAGVWGGIRECPNPEFAVGFQLRSEPNQLIADDSTANDLHLICSGGGLLEGNGNTFGNWTEERRCPRGTQLCGLRTQVEDQGASDDTSLNNVDMVCCGI